MRIFIIFLFIFSLIKADDLQKAVNAKSVSEYDIALNLLKNSCFKNNTKSCYILGLCF